MNDEPPSKARWAWRSWSGPAPLFGLDELADRPDAPVVAVEGEKATLAARMLFPDHVVITSPGGSNRANKADWSPLRSRRMIVWPDADGPGSKYADDIVRLSLEAGAESVSIVQVLEDWPEGWDVADDLPEGVTIENLRRMVASARQWLDVAKPGPESAHRDPLEFLRKLPSNPTLEAVGEALRAFATGVVRCSQLDRAVARESAIEILKEKGRSCPAKLVDAALADAMLKGGQTDDTGGLTLREVLPADGPVDGAALLDDLAAAFRRYIMLPDHAAETLALWVAFAHAFEVFHVAPICCVSSAEKGSGKTTLLDIVAALVQRPLMAANARIAAIFRSIEAFKPTLLIDEADSFFQGDDELRGILNAGHRRGGAVLRTVGDDHDPKSFPVWSPKAIALIGDLPGTLEDRAIVIRLRRASRDEFALIKRFKLGTSETKLEPIARRTARWSTDNLDDLKAADPDMPTCLYGRAADNWRPLLAVADAAGGEWPTMARAAAEALSGRSESESQGVLLLEDLRSLFDRTESGNQPIERWSSSNLVEELVKMEARPWPEFSRGRPLTVRQLARLLRPFEIQPRKIRFGETTANGYSRAQFIDAWGRYLKQEIRIEYPPPPISSGTPEHCNGDGGFRRIPSGTLKARVPDGKGRKGNGDGDCSGVPIEIPPHKDPAHIPDEIDNEGPSRIPGSDDDLDENEAPSEHRV